MAELPTARHLLPELLPKQVDDNAILRGEHVDMILPETFGAELHRGDSSLDLIIFPAYQPDRELELSRLSKASAACELMRCLANARNLADHGLPEATRLVGVAPAYSLTFSDLDQSGESVLRLLRVKSD